jgi:hypothetical protein
MEKRSTDVAVIPDVHLGTYGCHAKVLANYLKKFFSDIPILNGQIFKH